MFEIWHLSVSRSSAILDKPATAAFPLLDLNKYHRKRKSAIIRCRVVCIEINTTVLIFELLLCGGVTKDLVTPTFFSVFD
jgi:hypothetical protein